MPLARASEISRDCPACSRVTAHILRFKKNGSDILQCAVCGLGRAETSNFDPSTYYTADYFSGGHADGYSDYRGAEAVLRREFAGTVDFIGGFRSGGKLLEVGCAYGFFSRRRAVISKLPASNWPMTQPLIVAVKDCTCCRASPMKPTLHKLVAWT